MSGKPPANRMSLQTFKGKLVGAKKGFKLLKQKRDALKARFQAMLKEIVETKLEAGQALKDANFSYAKANWANGGEDITATVLERASKPSITCQTRAENVAGVKLPVFKMTHDPAKDVAMQTLGVTQGGSVIGTCRETYFHAVTALIKLASLQTAFRTLDEEIKMTSRRVNALEYVIIPRIEDIIAEIITELDEQARDDFIRIKKVVQKKREKKAREALENEALAAAAAPPAPAPAAKRMMEPAPAPAPATSQHFTAGRQEAPATHFTSGQPEVFASQPRVVQQPPTGSRIMPPGQLPQSYQQGQQMDAVQSQTGQKGTGKGRDLIF